MLAFRESRDNAALLICTAGAHAIQQHPPAAYLRYPANGGVQMKPLSQTCDTACLRRPTRMRQSHSISHTLCLQRHILLCCLHVAAASFGQVVGPRWCSAFIDQTHNLAWLMRRRAIQFAPAAARLRTHLLEAGLWSCAGPVSQLRTRGSLLS